MKKVYTEDDLLLYIYNELSSDNRNEIESELQQNKELRKTLDDLRESIASLKEVESEPSEAIVAKIVEYGQTVPTPQVH